MPITFFEANSAPVDSVSATNASTAMMIPPTNLVKGDLLVVVGQYRATADPIGILNDSNHAWTNLIQSGTASVSLRMFYTTFKGSWGANSNVSVTVLGGGSLAMTGVLLAFRPSLPTNNWRVNRGPGTTVFVAGTTPFAKTITGVTPSANSTVTVAAWGSVDDNTWGNIQGTGWVKTGLSAQYRNTTGSQQSLALAYNIKSTANATGNVSQDQLTLGGDPGATQIVTFEEFAPDTGLELIYDGANDMSSWTVGRTTKSGTTEVTIVEDGTAGWHSLYGPEISLYEFAANTGVQVSVEVKRGVGTRDYAVWLYNQKKVVDVDLWMDLDSPYECRNMTSNNVDSTTFLVTQLSNGWQKITMDTILRTATNVTIIVDMLSTVDNYTGDTTSSIIIRNPILYRKRPRRVIQY